MTFTASNQLRKLLPTDTTRLCPTLALYALHSGAGIQQQSPSQLNQEKVTKGRELWRKCTALLGKQQECGTKVTATAWGHQMKEGSILHYVVQPVYWGGEAEINEYLSCRRVHFHPNLSQPDASSCPATPSQPNDLSLTVHLTTEYKEPVTQQLIME